MSNRKRPTTAILGRYWHGNPVIGFFVRVFRMTGKRKPRQKKPSHSEYHLTSEQLSRVISACTVGRDRIILKLLAYTGMRRAEVAGLQIESILWDENLISIANGKGQKQRYVPLPENLKFDIREYVAGRITGPLIVSRTVGQISVRQINRIVAAVGKVSDVSNPDPARRSLTCHLFRHTFARLWKDRGGDIESLSRILGHASVKTTWDLYGTQSIEDVKQNYQKTFGSLTYEEGKQHRVKK